MKDHYLLTVRATDRPGLLHLITGVLNRKLVPIISLTAAPTDIHGIVLITLEINISEKALQPLLYKLENIIEVFATEAILLKKAVTERTVFFKLKKEFLASPQAIAISKFDARLVNLNNSGIVLSKSGSEAVITRLYNALEGPFLLGLSQTGLISDSKLIGEEQSSVINRLAA